MFWFYWWRVETKSGARLSYPPLEQNYSKLNFILTCNIPVGRAHASPRRGRARTRDRGADSDSEVHVMVSPPSVNARPPSLSRKCLTRIVPVKGRLVGGEFSERRSSHHSLLGAITADGLGIRRSIASCDLLEGPTCYSAHSHAPLHSEVAARSPTPSAPPLLGRCEATGSIPL